MKGRKLTQSPGGATHQVRETDVGEEADAILRHRNNRPLQQRQRAQRLRHLHMLSA